jgi:dienelactone hydrolase
MIDDALIGEWGHSILLSHGAKTEKVFILLHGLTASPPQFAEFGRRLHERGSNVVIPRLPRHGYADRMTEILSELDRDELVDFARTAVDSARELGKRVVVTGFSIGGLLAAWVAQHVEVDRVVAIAPFLGLSWVPERLAPLAAALTLRLPNRFFWWHPFLRERLLPAHGYPRYPTHAIARAYRMAHELFDDAQTTRPETPSIALVINDSEFSVSNRSIVRLAKVWSRYEGVDVTTHHLHGLPPSHDIIEPLREPKIVARIYPELVDLVDR